jgi:hypothetical protein
MFQIDGHLACQRDTLSTDRPNQIRIERDSNGLARKEIRLYNAYASTIPVGHPCLVRYDGDEETNPFVVSGASASGTAILEIFCTPQVAVPASSWGWFTIEGYCQALVEGTTDVAKDDFLKLVIATTSGVIKDTATQPGTANSVGIARAAQTANSAVLTDVYLIGERHATAQS